MPAWLYGILPDYFEDVTPEIVDNSVRPPEDTGITDSRKKRSRKMERITGTMRMTSAQLDAFEEWYYDTLEHGNLRFDWVHWRTRVACTCKFLAPHIPHHKNGVYFVQLKLVMVLP